MKKAIYCLTMLYFCSLPLLAEQEQANVEIDGCEVLNVALQSRIDKAKYAKPDDDNAMLNLEEMNNAGCLSSLSEENNRQLREGLKATFDYLAKSGRHRELCPIFDRISILENSDEDKRIHAAFKILYCFAKPASDLSDIAPVWSEQDAAAIYDRVVASRLIGDLKTKLRLAFREQRLYAPAGDNAAEYGIQVREILHALDTETESIMLDLAPYIVVAAEQAIGRGNEKEFLRLVELLRRVDPGSISLPRLDAMVQKTEE